MKIQNRRNRSERVQGYFPRALFVFGGTMIEMEEDELECAVSPKVLNIVMEICGPETRDMLLYPVVENVRSSDRAV